MPITNRKKVAILNSAKVRNRYPYILICLIWVRRSETCFGSERKLCHTICCHLLWIAGLKSIIISYWLTLHAFLHWIDHICLKLLLSVNTFILTSVIVWGGLCHLLRVVGCSRYSWNLAWLNENLLLILNYGIFNLINVLIMVHAMYSLYYHFSVRLWPLMRALRCTSSVFIRGTIYLVGKRCELFLCILLIT